MHLRGKRADSAQFMAKIVHFRRERADSAQFMAKIVHFQRERTNPAQSMGEILHLWRERADSAQSRGEILHLRRKRVDSAQNTEYEIHRVLTVETLKNRCSNICILRAYGENTCQGPLFGGNKKRNRKTSEAQTKRENL